MPNTAENASSQGIARHATFFRHSGWMMISAVGGGMLMLLVHFLSKKIPAEEYGLFGALMAVATCVPAAPLQMAMAHQTASAEATNREREVSGMIRLLALGTLVLWAIAAALILVFHGRILRDWETSNTAALYVMLPVILLSLWVPVFTGVVQGQQNFFWLGWAGILNGVVRVGGATLAVIGFAANAAGMMGGVLLGMVIMQGILLWQSRSLWLLTPLPFDWRTLLRQVLPLALGFGAYQFLFTADTMFAKSYFDADQVGFYVAAGTLSRAVMWLVLPIAAVMFPRIVHSVARAEKTDLVGIVLVGTAILAICGAIGLWLIGPWIVPFVFKPSYVRVATTVLPWYAGAMVPLALANVLLNNLLARGSNRFVPAVCVLAIAYAVALTRFHASFIMLLQVFGISNLLLLALCAWYTWRERT